MTKLGDFRKFLVPKLLAKVALIFVDFLVYFERPFKVQTAATTTLLGNILSEIGLLFNLTSGHTVHNHCCGIKENESSEMNRKSTKQTNRVLTESCFSCAWLLAIPIFLASSHGLGKWIL